MSESNLKPSTDKLCEPTRLTSGEGNAECAPDERHQSFSRVLSLRRDYRIVNESLQSSPGIAFAGFVTPQIEPLKNENRSEFYPSLSLMGIISVLIHVGQPIIFLRACTNYRQVNPFIE
jgi:hypothetical protein